MYSRETGMTPSGNYTAEYLRARYAEKTAPRRSPFKAITQDIELPDEKPDNTVNIEPSDGTHSSAQENSGIGDFISNLESDDLLLLAVLAFLLLGDKSKKNFDLILAAALLFVEFG